MAVFVILLAGISPVYAQDNDFREKLTGLKWVAYSPTNCDPDQNRWPPADSIKEDLRTLRDAGFDGLVTYSSKESVYLFKSEISPEPQKASIEFTFVPSYGSYDDLEGKISGVNDPSNYKVAVYIRVNGWWTKPYWNDPLTAVNNDGTFVCDVTTGGIDERATEIRAYLLPDGYDPPLAGGLSSLTEELKQKAVANADVLRGVEE